MPTNQSSFFLAAAMMLVAMPSVFAQETMFNVDMTCAPQGFTDVFVTGPWCGWCANDAYNTLTDPDGDGIYSVTLDETVTGTIEYKYAINGFADQENLINDMIDGASCAPITDYNAYANRQVLQGSTTYDYYGTCDGTCNDIPPVQGGDVLFRVDMSEYSGSFTTVNLNGSFNGWCGSCATMIDNDGDSVYELSVELDVGFYEYRFTLDGFTSIEEFTEGAPCTSTIDGYTNRSIEVLASTNVELDVVCWNECISCNDSYAEGLIWSNDVSNCDDWTFGNAADEIGAPWSTIDLNFECTTNGPSGPFNNWAGGQGLDSYGSPAPAINSTTSENGFLIVDSDFHGAESSYDANWVENSWVQTAAPIDCSVNPYVAISFETRYRCWDNGASDGNEKCFVEISRDGTTWPDLTQTYITTWKDEGLIAYGIDTIQCRYEVFPESETEFETDNPDYREIDITEAAGGQSEVWIRFHWVGTWGYSWEIDDIALHPLRANDLRFTDQVSYTDYLQSGIYENGAWALGQIPDSLYAGAQVYNFGFSTQEDVLLDLNVNGDMYSSAMVDSVQYTDTMNLQTAYYALDTGVYVINYSVSATNPEDMPSLINTSQTFEVTEFSYGRDNGQIFESYGGAHEYAAMPFYQIHNDVTIYGMDVAIMEGGTPGASMRAYLIDLEDPENIGSGGLFRSPGDLNAIASSGETSLNAEVATAGTGPVLWYTFEFEEPYTASAGQTLGAVFEHHGEDTLQIGESTTSFKGTAAIFGPRWTGDASPYAWRSSKEMPMVRLNLDANLVATEPAILGCMNPWACNFDAQATNDDGSCLVIGESCNDGYDFTFDDIVTQDCQCEGEGGIYGCTNASACNYDAEANIDDGSCVGGFQSDSPWLSLELIQEHTGGVLAGMSTWRLYVNTPSEDDMVFACGGDEEAPLILESTSSPAWFQHPLPESALVTDIDPTMYLANPELQFDSWLTVGAEDNTAAEDIIILDDPSYDVFAAFEAGENIEYSGSFGIAWLEIPVEPNVEAISGADKKVLLAQLTTAGEVSGQIQVRVFLNGDNTNPFIELLPINVVAPPEGCTDSSACNYSADVCFDDGSCDYSCLGCTDFEAFNYDPAATADDGTCVYFITSCEFIGQEGWGELEAGLYSDSTLWHYQGDEASGEWVLHMPELVVEPASGSTFAVMEWSNLTMSNMPPGLQPENIPSLMTGGEQVCVSYSGIPSEVGLYPVLVSGELTISLFGSPYVVGPYNVVGTIEVLPNPNPIAGCTYGNAANYVVYANVDDGSCVFAGCTEVDADNYQPLATVDDGTCVFGECEALCPADINGDGAVNTNDLLGLLGYFGLPCSE